MTRQARQLWQEKLDLLQAEEAKAVDPAQKFKIRKDIAEAKAKLAELDDESRGLGQLASTAGPDRAAARGPERAAARVGRTGATNNMPSDLTWLHLSDLHLCPPRTGWDAERILHALRADLDVLRREHGLAPDLLFFTGDAAFGELPESPIAGQFEDARRFFEEIRGLCGLAPERVFLVPGNHDVNREEITPFETDGLAKMRHEQVVEMLRRGDKTWRRVMERLADYRAFLDSAGYTHLLDDRERLLYARRLTIRGLDVGVAGLNSVWSCQGDDKGKLWLGGEWQLATVEAAIRDTKVKIGLIHHPLRWFSSGEAEEDLEPHFAEAVDFIEADNNVRKHLFQPVAFDVRDTLTGLAVGGHDKDSRRAPDT